MTRSEFIRQIAQQSKLTRQDAEAAVDAVFNSISSSLVSGHRVELRGFGSFGLKDRKAKISHNPKTGERVPVAAKRVMYFKPGLEMRRRVDSEGEQQ